jgi:F-type H+-transporting ATPase subunit delta
VIINEVSERYARALYEVAAAEKRLDQYLHDLRTIAEVFEKNTEIRDFFSSPTVTVETKAAILQKTFGHGDGKDGDAVRNLLLVLNEKQRMPFIPEIAYAFEHLMDDARGISRGTVRSASALASEQRKQLEETVKKVTGRQVILKFEMDPALVGGLIAQVGGWTFDDTLSSHLVALKENLNRNSVVGH